jgi:hypothetical protein
MPGVRRGVAVVAGLIAVVALTPTTVSTQEQFQFVVSARDAEGHPVVDLKPTEVLMMENGVANQIVKVEPFHMPVKLTIAVDNGILSKDAMVPYRSGLEGLVKALPPEVEVALIATAPQARFVVPSTLDRNRVLKGINAFAPEDAAPRFADTLVEFSKRLQDEFNKTKRIESIPVIVMVSTTAPENASYRATEINTALAFLTTRKARVYVTMTTNGHDTGVQPMIGIPLSKGTGGRYEAIGSAGRLATLLPEYGADIATLHQQRYNQVLVTAQRKQGGPLQNPRIELTRSNLTGQVSLDGLPEN